MSRRVMFPQSLIHLLDRRAPNQTLVALALDRGNVSADVLQRLGSWPSLMAVPLRDSWLGRVDAPTEAGMRFSTGTLAENIDVVIFWDMPPRNAKVTSRSARDPAFASELRRRQHLALATVAFRGGGIRFASGSGSVTPGSEQALVAVATELRRDVSDRLKFPTLWSCEIPYPPRRRWVWKSMS